MYLLTLPTYTHYRALARSGSRCSGSQPAGNFVSHPPAVGCHYFSPDLRSSFPAEERHCPLTSTKIYCLLTDAHGCEQLAQGCYTPLSRWELNVRPIDRKFNALQLRHCAALSTA